VNLDEKFSADAVFGLARMEVDSLMQNEGFDPDDVRDAMHKATLPTARPPEVLSPPEPAHQLAVEASAAASGPVRAAAVPPSSVEVSRPAVHFEEPAPGDVSDITVTSSSDSESPVNPRVRMPHRETRSTRPVLNELIRTESTKARVARACAAGASAAGALQPSRVTGQKEAEVLHEERKRALVEAQKKLNAQQRRSEEVQNQQPFTDADEYRAMLAHARVALTARYERDLATTQGTRVRHWKRVLRDRVRARVHRFQQMQDLKVRRKEDPNAQLPPGRQREPNPVDPMKKRRYSAHEQERKAVKSDESRARRGLPPIAKHSPGLGKGAKNNSKGDWSSPASASSSWTPHPWSYSANASSSWTPHYDHGKGFR